MSLLRIAWGQAWASLRYRAARHAMTFIAITLSVGFFAAVQSYREGMLLNSPPESAQTLHWFSLVTMAMALTGVTNAMVISVTERFTEIGTLKCLGASDRLVVLIFLLESWVLGTLGSGLGAFFGVSIGSKMASSPFQASVFIVSVLAGLGLTLVSSILPAMQAAKMPAAAALRTEI